MWCFVRCYFLLATLAVVLVAQQYTTGSLDGFVRDSTGAMMLGAKLTLTAQDTGQSTDSTSNREGFYVFSNLKPGTYTLRVEARGFKTETLETVVEPISKRSIDLKMEVGAVSERITVTDTAEYLQTDTAQVGRVITNADMEELPMNGRQMFSPVYLRTGVQDAQTNSFNQGGTDLGERTNINGSRDDDLALTIDGAQSYRTRGNSQLVGAYPIDSFQEVQVLTSNFLPEFGRSAGAQISYVTKSGTNKFHGSLYEFLRNDAFDAANYFDQGSKEKLRFNEFGGSIGGPIFIPKHFNTEKDKLFFFVSEEWTRYIHGSLDRARVPTAAERLGDFNNDPFGLPCPSDPANLDSQGNPIPFNGCVVPANRFSHNGVAAFNALPSPNMPLNSSLQNWSAFRNQRDISRADVLRVDYKINDKEHIYFRGSQDLYEHYDGTAGGISLAPSHLHRPNYSGVLNLTSILTPTLINDVTVARSLDVVDVETIGTRYQRSQYGFNFAYLIPEGKLIPDKIPTITLSQGFQGIDGGPYPASSKGPITSIYDNLTKIFRTHTFKFGTYIERSGENDFDQINISAQGLGNNQNGTFHFKGTGTGNVLENVLLGNFDSYAEIGPKDFTVWRSTGVDLYAQDSWKVRPGLTLEGGVRYNVWQPWYALWNNIAEFNPKYFDPAKAPQIDPNTGQIVPGSGDIYNGIVLPGKGFTAGAKGRVAAAADPNVNRLFHNLPRGFSKTPFGLFDPRFGFAWVPFGDTNFVVRGGAGVFHSRLFLNDSTLLGGNPPLQPTQQTSQGNIDTFSSSPGTIVFPTSITAQDYRFPFPSTYQWSLGVQRKLPGSFILDVAYIGRRATHLQRESDLNEPPPSDPNVVNVIDLLRPYQGYGLIRYSCNCAQSIYHGLQTELRRRLTHGLLVTAGYTYSHSIDNASSKRDLIANTYNDRDFRGSSDFDYRHILQLSWVYELPFWRTRHDVLGFVAGGWQLNGIGFIETGAPFTLIDGSGNANVGNINVPANDVGRLVVNKDSWSNWVSFPDGRTAADYIPAPGTFGNAARNSYHGPGLWNFDLSVSKNFYPIRGSEKVRAQFRFETFNTFNHPSKMGVDSDVTDPAFGSTGVTDPRAMQLGVRVTF